MQDRNSQICLFYYQKNLNIRNNKKLFYFTKENYLRILWNSDYAKYGLW